MIKCYLTFSTRLYRLIVFLLLPLLAVITAVLLGGLAAIFVLLPAEILADRLSFGGIAARGVGLPEYIKSSHRGLSVMRSALVCNLFRQLIYIVAVTAGCIGLGVAKDIFCMTGDLWMQAFDLCLLAAVLMAVFVTVVRFFELTWAGLIASNLCRCRIHSRNRSCCKESCAYGSTAAACSSGCARGGTAGGRETFGEELL